MIYFKIFIFLALVAMLFSRLNLLINFGRGQQEDQFLEIILIEDFI